MSAQAMLRQLTGLNVSRAQTDRAVRQRMDRTGQVNREHYLAGLTPAELAELVELVVVPESWMFRDPQAFEAATRFVQARLAYSARPVRILSVPCAAGEEPYSIAMALFDGGVAPSSFTIDAFDLSPVCVERARKGVYGRNAFRNKDLTFRDRYFSAIGNDEYRIDDAVRAQVRIAQGNLLAMDTAAYARHYDVIFCRNLLIYFDKPTTADAIARLSAMLDDDGVLFAGYAEVPSFTQHGFAPLPHRNAFGLRKEHAAPRHAVPTKPPQAALTPPGPPIARARAQVPAPPPARAPQRHGAPAGARPAAMPRPAGPPAAASRAWPARAAGSHAAPEAVPQPPGIAGARALADRGLSDQAAAACQAVLARDAHSADAADAYFILGMLREQARDAREAEQYWRRCVYLQPDHYDALCHLALLAEQQGDADGAATLKARARRIYQRNQRDATKAES